jgi:hypothetical protein
VIGAALGRSALRVNQHRSASPGTGGRVRRGLRLIVPGSRVSQGEGLSILILRFSLFG